LNSKPLSVWSLIVGFWSPIVKIGSLTENDVELIVVVLPLIIKLPPTVILSPIVTSETAPLKSGNRMEVGNIPTGLQVYNVELIVGNGGNSVRAAGATATIVSQEWEYTQIKMPSGEIRLVHKKCYATLGQVSNLDHSSVVIWKAWRSRWMWKRPTVLGKSMNPVDHPHGGWEGHSPIGMKAPKTPWWMPALGYKTRSRKKTTSRWILKTRDWKLMV